ncbi:alpha-catulin [Caerostris extrusa]|uniref:Alpha-catulin n=1 Tax=Caerostris extrusa TaxID=172846 RepID=A0AAV4U7R4_CAEEX|nr:alpha-catulin [Caerostris extrusa]
MELIGPRGDEPYDAGERRLPQPAEQRPGRGRGRRTLTDSAYTSHEHRERILLLCDRLKMELHQLLRVGVQLQIGQMSPTEEMEAAIHETLRAAKDLKLNSSWDSTATFIKIGQFFSAEEAGGKTYPSA